MVVVCGARGLCASSLTEQPPLESRSHTESHPPARTGARRAQSLAATQLDLDACLRAIGVANGLAAAVGAFPNYTPLSLCLVTHRLLKQSEVAEQREAGGQKKDVTTPGDGGGAAVAPSAAPARAAPTVRAVGGTILLVEAVAALATRALVRATPRCVVGGYFARLALLFLDECVVKAARERFHVADIVVIVGMAAAMVTIGFVQARRRCAGFLWSPPPRPSGSGDATCT